MRSVVSCIHCRAQYNTKTVSTCPACNGIPNDKSDINIRVLYGYAKLVEKIIEEAMKQPISSVSQKLNIEFALHSPLVQHYADCFEYDEKSIREAILRANKKINYTGLKIKKTKNIGQLMLI